MARRDKRLGEAMARIGPVRRAISPDVFSSVVHSIVGQQISTAAQVTVWNRLTARFGAINASVIHAAGVEDLQSTGLSYRKVEYIKSFAQQVYEGEFDVESLRAASDEEVIARLSSLRGIGVWTAEMLMTFCLCRPDVLSYGDLAILRGLRMLYRHRDIDRVRFERYRKRYSPCATVAALYLWAIAGGALPELIDPAAAGKTERK